MPTNSWGSPNNRGPIAPGMAGDMIAVPENPLTNIYTLRKVDFVMKDGQIVPRRRSQVRARRYQRKLGVWQVSFSQLR